MDGAMPRAHQLKEGETVIGRAPTCDLVITAPLMSRHHAVVRVDSKRVFLKDAGSTYGTTFKGAKLTAEQEIKPGDSFTLGPVTLTLDREVHESEVLSEKHQIFDESATIVKRMENLNLPPAAATVEAAAASAATTVQSPSVQRLRRERDGQRLRRARRKQRRRLPRLPRLPRQRRRNS